MDTFLRIMSSGYGFFLVTFAITMIIAKIMQMKGREIPAVVLAIICFTLGGISIYMILRGGV